MATTGDIDFATLDLQDALDLGILIEEDARERYLEFAEQLETHHTGQAAIFFRAMVRNETKHRDELAQRRWQLFGDRPTRVNANMLCEIEAPSYEDAKVFMSLREALDVALKAEIRAFDFFEAALPNVRDPQVRALFQELRDEEREHEELVRAELAKLPPGPDPRQDSQADEPVGH